MILLSTIERNITLKRDPRYGQKPFRRNRIRGENEQDNKYIVLGDLQVDEIRYSLHGTTTPAPTNKTNNYIIFTTPYSYIEHDVGIEHTSAKQKHISTSSEKEIFDIPVTESLRSSEKDAVSFWNLVTKHDRFKVQSKKELGDNGTQNLPTVFEYERPPLPTAPKGDYSVRILEKQENMNLINNKNMMSNKQYVDILSDVEKPPPPPDKSKVYGQWTSSKFVGNVLKYLKSINFYQNREQKKVPSTIPLVKISDTYPYQSEFKLSKLRPPLRFHRRNFVDKSHVLKKRDINQQQINLKIIETDVRNDILKSHSETQPKSVEVTNRGEANHVVRKKYITNFEKQSLESEETSYISRESLKEPALQSATSLNSQKTLPDLERHRGSNLMTILPFLKSVEYFIDDHQNNQSKRTNDNDMYSKTFANANKWHNVKSYSNDYTPRRIDLDLDGKSNIEVKIAEANKKQPSPRIKYKHDRRKLIQDNDENIARGRALAEKITDLATENKKSVAALKFNHGFLPGHEKKMKVSNKFGAFTKTASKHYKMNSEGHFNKQVKLGNALNERYIIGQKKEQSIQSFIGGDDKIPDINKYRSDLDNEYDNVPSSLGPKVCKSTEPNDRVLYIQQDGSIDMTHILSPVRKKNNGVEFISQNYRRCSMNDSPFEKSLYLLIDWNKTPVKLFGGAYPRKTRDLCGFF